MARTKTYQVVHGRIRFICSECGAKRSLSVPLTVRYRNFRCHRCKAMSRGMLNHRNQRREQQTGKVSMVLSSGKEIEIELQDRSPGGFGIKVPPGNGRRMRLKEEVIFKCGWNPKLFAGGRYIIKSINGDRVGIENVARRTLS
ncbi:MAG: hypothetical protein ABR512_07275 [Desulfopila sp.]